MKNNKTIGVTIRFWTDKLEVKREGKSKLACWDSGSVSLEANKEKGIKADVVMFSGLDSIIQKVEQLLHRNKIVIAKD